MFLQFTKFLSPFPPPPPFLEKVDPFFSKFGNILSCLTKNPPHFGKYPLGSLWEQPKMANLWYFCCHISKLISFFFKSKTFFFERSYHYSSSSLWKKLIVFVVYFGPPLPLHATFLWKQNPKLFLWVGLSFSMLKYWKLPSYNISNQIFSINLELIRPEKQYSLSNSNYFKCLKIQFPHHMMIPKLMQSTYSVFYFLFSFWKCQSFQKKKICDFSTTNFNPP